MTDLVTQVTALSEEQKTEFFTQALGQLTVKEALALVKHLEEEWDVEASPQMPDFGQLPKPEAEEEEQSEFAVIVTDIGAKKISVIKAVRSLVAGLSLKDGRDLIATLPATVKDKASKDEADQMKKALEEAGATVEIK